MANIARVAVEQTAYHYDKLYDYALPPGSEGLQPGCRVMVGFGSGRRSRTGLVVELTEGDTNGLKPVLSVVDRQPALDAEGLMLLRWLKENTFCTWFDALSVLLPAGFGVRIQQLYALAPNWQNLLEDRPQEADEERICEFLRRRRQATPQAALLEALGLAENCPALQNLLGAGIVVVSEEAKRRAGDEKLTMVALTEEPPAKKLTEKQQSVVDLLAQVDALLVYCDESALEEKLISEITVEELLEANHLDKKLLPVLAEQTITYSVEIPFFRTKTVTVKADKIQIIGLPEDGSVTAKCTQDLSITLLGTLTAVNGYKTDKLTVTVDYQLLRENTVTGLYEGAAVITTGDSRVCIDGSEYILQVEVTVVTDPASIG